MQIEYTEAQIEIVAAQIIENVPNKTLCFYGQMGAGKTTLIKALVKLLKGSSEANSPTFGIVNEYFDSKEDLIAYHFDFYRLNDESEAYDFGIEDYLNSDVWIFMEWPDKIASILPEDSVKIGIEVINPTTRRLTF